MLKRATGAMLALLALAGPSLAWGTDIYVKRAAMAEIGRQMCGIGNHRLAERYKRSAAFFSGASRPLVEERVRLQKERIVATLINSSAIDTFCGRIRAGDF